MWTGQWVRVGFQEGYSAKQREGSRGFCSNNVSEPPKGPKALTPPTPGKGGPVGRFRMCFFNSEGLGAGDAA